MFLWENAEKIGALSAAAGVLLSFFALGFASGQISSGRATRREATAKDVWRTYERLSFENPRISRPDEFQLIDDAGQFNGSPEEFVKYRWYVSIMFLACEEILDSYKGRKDWNDAVAGQIRKHRKFLRSQRFTQSTTNIATRNNRLNSIITSVLAEGDGHDRKDKL